MKKTMTKTLSIALVIMLLASLLTVGTFAYNDEYATIELPETFIGDEYSNMEDDGYINVWYDEVEVAEDGIEYYTGNNIDMFIEIPSLFTSDNLEDYCNDETVELVEGYVYEGDITSSEYNYITVNGVDAVAIDVYYTYRGEGESGAVKRLKCLYSEVIYVVDGYVVTLDIDVASGAEDLIAERDRIANLFATSIKLNAEGAEEFANDFGTGLSVFFIILIGGFVIFVVVIVVVIVLVVKSSNKKKAQQPVYPYNVNNVPPQYFNPNGNVPQQPYNPNMGTPSYAQPPVTENTENNTENLDN